MESQNSAMRTLEYVQQKRTGSRTYAQGIFAFAVFAVSILIAFFVYIPFITSTQKIVKDREAVDLEVQSLQLKFDEINNYDKEKLSNQLAAAKKYVPDSIRVAQLATFINQTAKQHKLEVSQLGINENQLEIKPAGSEEQTKLLGSSKYEKKVFFGKVEGPFSFRGTRDAIYGFLDFLVVGGYATNFDQVSITASDKDTEWTVSLAASYYYLQPLQRVEPGRALLPIQESALTPISVVTTPTIEQPSEIPTSSVTPTPTTTP